MHETYVTEETTISDATTAGTTGQRRTTRDTVSTPTAASCASGRGPVSQARRPMPGYCAHPAGAFAQPEFDLDSAKQSQNPDDEPPC